MTRPPLTDDGQAARGPLTVDITTQRSDISIVDTVNVMLRNRRLIIGMAVAALVLSAVITLLKERTYTSSAIFVTETRRGAADLANVAAQLGVNVGMQTGERPPRFYGNLLKSRLILRDVLLRKYELTTRQGQKQSGNLLELLDVEAPNRRLREERGLELLARAIATDVDRETGMVTYAVTMPDAELARAVADALLAAVARFNLETRQSQAREERLFVEGRLAVALVELESAQRDLAVFLQSNREFEGSAQKQIQYQNLTQNVTLRRELHLSLSEALERARIAEVQSMPVLTIVEPPQVPAEPDSRGGFVRMILAGMLGVFIALLIAFSRQFGAASQSNEEESIVEFRRLRQEMLRDLRRPWRALARSK